MRFASFSVIEMKRVVEGGDSYWICASLGFPQGGSLYRSERFVTNRRLGRSAESAVILPYGRLYSRYRYRMPRKIRIVSGIG